MRIKQHLYWGLPVTVLLIGIIILFFQNLSEVTEAPEENWSRELHIGETSTNNYPYVKQINEQSFELLEFSEDSLVKKTFNSYEEVDEYRFADIDVTKWTQAYVNGTDLIYFDYHDIYNGNSGEKITAADKFYPLSNHVFYLKENQLFQLTQDKESIHLHTFKNAFDQIIPIETGLGVYFLDYYRDHGKLHVNMYEVKDYDAELLTQQTLNIHYKEQIKQVVYTVKEGTTALVVQTEIKGTGGNQPINTVYYYDSTLSEISKIQFDDPYGQGMLHEVHDISLTFIDEQLRILFSAKGSSNTPFKETKAFNIYEALQEDGVFKVERRSNTPYLSKKPQWISSNLISWIEISNESNPVFISSDDPKLIENTKNVDNDDLVSGLGKTLGMFSASFFGIILSALWWVGPVLFLLIAFIVKRKVTDHDPNWVYYAGVILYFLSFIIFKDQFCIDTISAQAPKYLTFVGSSYVYFFLFGIVSYISASIGSNKHEWSSPVKLVYFMATHMAQMTVLFGPYFL